MSLLNYRKHENESVEGETYLNVLCETSNSVTLLNNPHTEPSTIDLRQFTDRFHEPGDRTIVSGHTTYNKREQAKHEQARIRSVGLGGSYAMVMKGYKNTYRPGRGMNLLYRLREISCNSTLMNENRILDHDQNAKTASHMQ
ncbi:hypothetical protein VNO77_25930 [Canavalia gladiata]|uniref:Uncharacterized protein n=1 Tax=Canavalia gladiata TaxID=3824 RepID=A0AAN9KRH4_CANGL